MLDNWTLDYWKRCAERRDAGEQLDAMQAYYARRWDDHLRMNRPHHLFRRAGDNWHRCGTFPTAYEAWHATRFWNCGRLCTDDFDVRPAE